MPTSRGSIHHTLRGDVRALASALVQADACLNAASATTKQATAGEVSQLLGLPHVELFPYARTALHALLLSLRLPKGSDVLMTPITIRPMLDIILHLGHKPVFVDLELQTFCACPKDLERKIGGKKGCLLLTYLFGYVPDVERIMQISATAGLPVIEDISQAIGARHRGRPLGSYGDAAIYSASLTKYVDAYGGGFAATTSSILAERLREQSRGLTRPDPVRLRRGIGRTLAWNLLLGRHVFHLFTFPALWMLRSLHRSTFERLLGPATVSSGDCGKLPAHWFEAITTLQCREMRRGIRRLASRIEQRRSIAHRALAALEGSIGSPSQPSAEEKARIQAESIWWQLVVQVQDLNRAREVLFRHGIETGGTNLVNLAEASGEHLPKAIALKTRYIFIPLHAHSSEADYTRIVQVLRQAEQLDLAA